MPGTAEDYVHRIGRCGRAGATGVAYAMFTTANARLGKQLVGILEEAQQNVPSELRMYAQVSGGGGGNGKNCLLRLPGSLSCICMSLFCHDAACLLYARVCSVMMQLVCCMLDCIVRA